MNPHPKCRERHYWDKRFRLVGWLFLGVGFYLALFTDNTRASLISFGFSLLYIVLNEIQQIRHLKWHIITEEAGDHEKTD